MQVLNPLCLSQFKVVRYTVAVNTQVVLKVAVWILEILSKSPRAVAPEEILTSNQKKGL